jgi:hypothetical protein
MLQTNSSTNAQSRHTTSSAAKSRCPPPRARVCMSSVERKNDSQASERLMVDRIGRNRNTE